MKLTVVLVHGAYAESSSWSGEIPDASHVVGISYPAETAELVALAAGQQALTGA
jgi:hypothetical protein